MLLKGLLSTVCLALLIPSGLVADAWNKKTVVTTSGPLQIPGKTLPAGKYVFKLADSMSNRHIVQVFSEDERTIHNTILAIPNYRLKPTGETEFTFWETPSGEPPALRSWFYPGDNFGQEFAYPQKDAVKLAQVNHEPVPTVFDSEPGSMTSGRVGTTTPDEALKEDMTDVEAPPAPPAQSEPESAVESEEDPTLMAQNQPPAETPAPLAEEQPKTEMPDRLPDTASPLPLIGLASLLALGGAATLRLVSRMKS